MTLVKFNSDVFPYCKGDVVRLEGDDKARVDKVAKARKLENVYSEVKAEKKAAEKPAEKAADK